MINSFDEFFKSEMTGVAFDYPVEAAQYAWNYQQQKIDELEKKLKDRKSKTIQAINNKGMWVGDEYMIPVNYIEDIQND